MTRPKLSQPQDTVCLLQIWLNIAVIACCLLLTTPACHLHCLHICPLHREIDQQTDLNQKGLVWGLFTFEPG